MNPVPVVPGNDFMDSISGHVINGGDITDDGMHIFLDDGRVVIFTGQFMAFVGMLDKRSIN